jgi:TusA-related sulfurtransferase
LKIELSAGGIYLEADYIMDVNGKPCPVPLIMTKKKIAKIDKGKILEVITESIVVKENIERFSKKKYELIHINEKDRIFKIYIKK